MEPLSKKQIKIVTGDPAKDFVVSFAKLDTLLYQWAQATLPIEDQDKFLDYIRTELPWPENVPLEPHHLLQLSKNVQKYKDEYNTALAEAVGPAGPMTQALSESVFTLTRDPQTGRPVPLPGQYVPQTGAFQEPSAEVRLSSGVDFAACKMPPKSAAPEVSPLTVSGSAEALQLLKIAFATAFILQACPDIVSWGCNLLRQSGQVSPEAVEDVRTRLTPRR